MRLSRMWASSSAVKPDAPWFCTLAEAFFSAAREAFGTLVEGVAGVGVADPVPVAHTVLCMLHGFTDFACKGRTVPFEAESEDAQIARLIEAVVEFTVSSAEAPPRGGRRFPGPGTTA